MDSWAGWVPIETRWTSVEMALEALGYMPRMGIAAFVGGALVNHAANEDRRIQEATLNHFGGIFAGDTRELVERRFNLATSNMAFLYATGRVEIMTGQERFGREAFRGSHYVRAVDPLSAQITMRPFTQHNNYFFLTNPNDTALFSFIFNLSFAIINMN